MVGGTDYARPQHRKTSWTRAGARAPLGLQHLRPQIAQTDSGNQRCKVVQQSNCFQSSSFNIQHNIQHNISPLFELKARTFRTL